MIYQQTTSKKFAYADDLAIMHSAPKLQTLEGILNQDMANLSSNPHIYRSGNYSSVSLKQWTTAFHLYIKKAKRELNITVKRRTLPFCSEPTYLGMKLDRSLTHRQHLESLSKKLTARVGLLRRLASSKWGSNTKTTRTATLALIHSAAKYCASVWCRSKHTRLVDKLIHDALRLVTGCLRPTPINNLFVLAGNIPTELRRKRSALSLSRRTIELEHLLHDQLLFTPSTQKLELKSRHYFVPGCTGTTKDLDKSNTTAAFRADHKWNTEWQKNIYRLHTFIPSPGPSLPGMTLLRTSWVRLNRLRTVVELFRSTMHNRDLVSLANCRCGPEEQTADHILASCPLYHHPNGTLGLAALDDYTVDRVKRTTLYIL